jgi:hypothetical protein
LIELLLVVGFLAVAATGSVVLFGDELRQAFGVRPASQAAPRAP